MDGSAEKVALDSLRENAFKENTAGSKPGNVCVLLKSMAMFQITRT